MMKKGKPIETPLPEATIQHIQSFLSGKEAARSTILSKSWYNAWLTRPNLDFDDRDFNISSRESYGEFLKYAWETTKRYQELRLNIESFRLLCLMKTFYDSTEYIHNLIVCAMKIGATHVELDKSCSDFDLPPEVLGSQTLLKLSLKWCKIDGNHVVSCSALKSLTLDGVELTSDDMLDKILSCITSIEELSLSVAIGSASRRMNLYEFHKLRRLFLSGDIVVSMFLINDDFASRFPCLNDLSIHRWGWSIYSKEIKIASTSLQTISFKPETGSWKAKFDVPNIRNFTYSGSCSSSDHLSIKAAPSREWDLDISIKCNQFYKTSWFLNLKKYLTKFRLSRISLSINLDVSFRKGERSNDTEHQVDAFDAVPAKALVVENLMIKAPSSFCCALLVRLFGICRPKFITLYRPIPIHYKDYTGHILDALCKRLMQQQSITPNCNCGIPDQMIGQFGLKEVKVEVYEMIDTEWLPLLLSKPLDTNEPLAKQQKIRFQLIWD